MKNEVFKRQINLATEMLTRIPPMMALQTFGFNQTMDLNGVALAVRESKRRGQPQEEFEKEVHARTASTVLRWDTDAGWAPVQLKNPDKNSETEPDEADTQPDEELDHHPFLRGVLLPNTWNDMSRYLHELENSPLLHPDWRPIIERFQKQLNTIINVTFAAKLEVAEELKEIVIDELALADVRGALTNKVNQESRKQGVDLDATAQKLHAAVRHTLGTDNRWGFESDTASPSKQPWQVWKK